MANTIRVRFTCGHLAHVPSDRQLGERFACLDCPMEWRNGMRVYPSHEVVRNVPLSALEIATDAYRAQPSAENRTALMLATEDHKREVLQRFGL